MALFWLSSMGASAALRASFKYSVNVEGCYSNGQLIGADTCIVDRDLETRAAVATHIGLSLMTGVAGLSALEWYISQLHKRRSNELILLPRLLFTACLVYYILTWYQGRSKTSQSAYQPQQQSEGYAMPTNPQSYAQQPQPQHPYVQKPYVQPFVQQTDVEQQFEHPYAQQPQQGHPYQQQHYATPQPYNGQVSYS